MIQDVIFTPENGVKAGRALLASVRVRNYGQEDEESVKVSVRIPELGVSASDYIDELEEGDTETSEELFLRIPQTAKAGLYQAVVEVTYKDGDRSTSETFNVEVLAETIVESDSQDTTYVSSDTRPQAANVGQTISYPITISNAGSTAKTYAITVSPVNWATFKISPTNLVVVEPGQSTLVYLYVTPSSGAEGENVFIVNIKSGATMKQIPLQANIEAGVDTEDEVTGWAGLKKSLEIGLVVLVVLLFILGLIIVFNKLTGPRDDDEDDEDDETQTYY